MTTDPTEAKNGPEWAHGFFIALRLLVVFFAFELFGKDASKEGWVMWMIVVAVGVLLPLARPLQNLRRAYLIEVQQWIMTQTLFLGLLPRPGHDSAIIAGCWLVWCGFLTGESLWNLKKSPVRDAGAWCVAASGAFPFIGAVWLVFHRASWFPLGFDPLIVLLTAAHFHHAGFTLPLMAGLNAKASPGCWTRFSCVAILAGVPLVAAGITCTHFGVLRFVEPFGVTVLVLGALGVAVSQIRRGVQIRSGLGFWTRTAFAVSGGSLLSAMILAMGFGLRHVVPNWALTMPQMWMIHGTLNAFGFGLCGLLAWRAGPESVRTKVA
jgi:hypothetical protein